MEEMNKKEGCKIRSIQLTESEAEEITNTPQIEGINKIIHQKRCSRAIKMDKDEVENKNQNLPFKNISKTNQPSKLGEQGIKFPFSLHDKNKKIPTEVDSLYYKSEYNTVINNLDKSNVESGYVSNVNFCYGSNNTSNPFSTNTHKVDYSNNERKEENENMNDSTVRSYRNFHLETLDKFKKKIHFNKYRTLNIQIMPKDNQLELEELKQEQNLHGYKIRKNEKPGGGENLIANNESRQVVKKTPAFVYSSQNTNILKRDRKVNLTETGNESENEEFEIEDPYAFFEVKNNFSNKISRFILKSKEEKEIISKRNIERNEQKIITLESENEEEHSQNEIKIENTNDDRGSDIDKNADIIKPSENPTKDEANSKHFRSNRNYSAMLSKSQNEYDLKEIISNDEKEDELSQDIITEEEDGEIQSRGGIVILKPNIFPQIKSKEEIEEANEHEVILQHNKLHAKDLLQITIKRIEICIRLIQKTWRAHRIKKISKSTKIQSLWRAFRLRQKFSPILYYYYIFGNQINTLQNFLDKRNRKIAFYKIFYMDKFEMYWDSIDKLRCLVLMRRSRKKFIYLKRESMNVENEKNLEISDKKENKKNNLINYNKPTEISENNLNTPISNKIMSIPKFLSHSYCFTKVNNEKYSERIYVKKIQEIWRNMAPLVKLQSSIKKKLSDIKIIKKKPIMPPVAKMKISVYNLILVLLIQRKWRDYLKKRKSFLKSHESVRTDNISCVPTPRVSQNPNFIMEKIDVQNTMEFLNSSNFSHLSMASNKKKSKYSENIFSQKSTNKNIAIKTKINNNNLIKFTKTQSNFNAISKRITKIQRFLKNKLDCTKTEEVKKIPKELTKISEISQIIEINIKPLKFEGDIKLRNKTPIILDKIPTLYLTKEIKLIEAIETIKTEEIKNHEKENVSEELKNEIGSDVRESPELISRVKSHLSTDDKSIIPKLNPIDLILILQTKFEATRSMSRVLTKSFTKNTFQEMRDYQLDDVAKQLFSILVKRKRIHLFLCPDYLIKVKRRIILIDFIFTLDHRIRNNVGSIILRKLKKHAENEKHKLFLENLYRQMHLEYINSIQTFLKVDKDELEMQVEIQVEDDLLNYGYNLYENKKHRDNLKWYQSPEMSLIASWESKKVEELKDSINESQISAEKKKDESYRKNNKLEFIKNSLRRNNRSREEAEMKSIAANIEINFSY